MSQPGTDRTDEFPPRDDMAGRALVVTESRSDADRQGRTRRPDAAFLTQILASRSHMGPFRRYRREEPATAMARYAAAAALIDGFGPVKRPA